MNAEALFYIYYHYYFLGILDCDERRGTILSLFSLFSRVSVSLGRTLLRIVFFQPIWASCCSCRVGWYGRQQQEESLLRPRHQHTPNMHVTVRLLRYSAAWGRALMSPLWRYRIPAFAAAIIVIGSWLYFYTYMNQNAPWAAFLTFLILDCGTSLLALIALLMRPLDLVVADRELVQHSVWLDEDETTSDWQPLTPQTEAPEPSPTQGILGLTQGDLGITLHTCVFVFAFVSSVLSDNLATFLQADDEVTVSEVILFATLDIVEDFFYCVGFLILAVTYRVVALQIWKLYHVLEDEFDHPTKDPPILLAILERSLHIYENIFGRTERLSAQTSVIAVAIISFAALEMASTVTEVFEEKNFDIDDIGHLAMLRLLLVLSGLILQVALAAADVMYASERLAEVLARWDAYWRLEHARGSYGSTESGSHNHQVLLPALAAACKAFGDRARSHPVRLRVSWFHLETEWSLGIAFLVVTVMLTIVGVKLPGGE